MKNGLFLAALLALTTTSAFAQVKTYTVGGGNPTQQLAQVESATELETFTGRTDKVKGTIKFDLAKRTGSGKITVDGSSIDTGLALRNEHMRGEMWLNTGKFNDITFETTKVQFVRGNQYKVTGKFTMRGVTKTVTTTATVKHQKGTETTAKAGFKGDILQIRTNFDVKLSDFGIKIAGPATGKVANNVRIGLTVYAQSGA